MHQADRSIRSRILEYIRQHKIKQIEVAKQTGVHHSILSLFLQGKINASPRVEQALESWLTKILSGATMNDANVKKTHLPVIPTDTSNFNEVKPREIEEYLIPIKIDLEFEGRKLKEYITWNFFERTLTPEIFARQVAVDYDLPPAFENEIAMIIAKTVNAHRRYFPQQPEMIKLIELDLRIDNVCLKDRFEWDINDFNNVPEDFAQNLCDELGLNHEFMVLIAHSIREQVEAHRREITDMGGEALMGMKKSMRILIESGQKFLAAGKNQEARTVTEDNYLRAANPIYYDEEDKLAYWEPKVEILDPEDLEKIEKLENRKLRYEKRRR